MSVNATRVKLHRSRRMKYGKSLKRVLKQKQIFHDLRDTSIQSINEIAIEPLQTAFPGNGKVVDPSLRLRPGSLAHRDSKASIS